MKDTACGKKSTSHQINKTNNEIAICCGVKKIININTVDCSAVTTSPRTSTNPNIWKLDLFLQAKNGTNEKRIENNWLASRIPLEKNIPLLTNHLEWLKTFCCVQPLHWEITLTHQTMHHQLYLISTESNNNSLPFVSIAQL